MPAYNPFIDHGANVEAWDGSPLISLSTLSTVPVNVMTAASQNMMSNMGSSGNTTNAAGTSQNIAIDVAVIVAIAGIMVWFFKHSGIRFVAAAGVSR